MTPTDFSAAGQQLYGRSSWEGQFAEALGLNRTTVWRYKNGKRAIPRSVALAIEALLGQRA